MKKTLIQKKRELVMKKTLIQKKKLFK